MKLSQTITTITAFLLLLIQSVSVWAMKPAPGTYVKTDETGRITACMYVNAIQGKGAMSIAANDLCIALEAIDAKEYVTEQLATDFVERVSGKKAIGMEGLRLTGENLRNAQTASPDHPHFTPERFSVAWGQHVEYELDGPDRITVKKCGANLDGTYVRDANRECLVTLPALLFAYEKTYCRPQYNSKTAPAGWYALERTDDTAAWPRGEKYVLRVNNPPRDDYWNLIADNRMNIVMDTRYTDSHFLFVSNSYGSQWIDNAWRDFAGSDLPDVNALFLHQYLTRNAPELAENPNAFFRVTDFWQGKHDVETWEVEIRQPTTDGDEKTGVARISSDGTIHLAKGADATLPKPKSKKKNKRKGA